MPQVHGKTWGKCWGKHWLAWALHGPHFSPLFRIRSSEALRESAEGIQEFRDLLQGSGPTTTAVRMR
jgi:hypothetical protein